MPNLKVSYKDSQNWVDINSNVVNWDTAAETFKDERTYPHYIAPEIVTDIWNGLIHDVQHLRWDAWYIEFWGKESEIHSLAKIQSCDTVIITDIDNDLKHTIDMQTSEWFIFNEPERVADTTNWKISFIYRTNRTVINKFNGLSNQVALVGSSTYNSKYDKLNLPTVSEQINVDWFDGSQKLLRETNKDGFKVLLYMTDANMQLFKADYNQNSFTIDAVTVIEKLPLEINQLGIDNYQIIVSVITNVDQDTKDLTPLNTHALVVTDSGTFTFHTDYSTEPNVDDTEQDKFSNDDGLGVTAKTISRQVTDIKLFMNTTDKNNLKLHYERGTATIDTVNILEKGIVDASPLSFGLWEVNIKGLTTTPFPNYPL